MTVISDNIVLLETKCGTFTLKVTGDDGTQKTMHSLYDPGAEARTIVDAFQFEGRGILVVLGLGLGYHISELARKFPETEIIVVEAVPEICEIAREHGPGFNERIRIWTGLTSDEVLRKITKCQMEKGMSPLSVFSLSSAVSAFPDFYRPILESLSNSSSVRLWERLRYPKLREETLRIVLIDSGYFLVKEAEKALRSLNHKVLRVPVYRDTNGESAIADFIETILNFRPDFFLTINHLGFDEEGVLSSFFHSIEMPVASWYVDSPSLIVGIFDKNVSSFTSLFLWDRAYMDDMSSMGFESIHHLPLGTDDGIFRPLRKQRKRLKKFYCDAGFVGNSMVEPVDEWMSKVNEELHPLIEELADKISSLAGIAVPASEVIKSDEKLLAAVPDEMEKRDFEAAVLWKSTLLYRLSCIERLAGFDTRIYGDTGWSTLIHSKKIKLFPPLNYYKELPLFYNACNINFNATSRQMSEAVNQRVFDVAACGCFLLTDYQESLNDLFEVGKEIITYKHKDEIPEIVKFYLKSSREKESIVTKGRKRVLKEHTYRHRLKKLIRCMKERYA